MHLETYPDGASDTDCYSVWVQAVPAGVPNLAWFIDGEEVLKFRGDNVIYVSGGGTRFVEARNPDASASIHVTIVEVLVTATPPSQTTLAITAEPRMPEVSGTATVRGPGSGITWG